MLASSSVASSAPPEEGSGPVSDMTVLTLTRLVPTVASTTVARPLKAAGEGEEVVLQPKPTAGAIAIQRVSNHHGRAMLGSEIAGSRATRSFITDTPCENWVCGSRQRGIVSRWPAGRPGKSGAESQDQIGLKSESRTDHCNY